MDYEKKYKEALEKAKKEWSSNLDNAYKNYRERLEIIFPELKGSEDGKNKRISKEITQFLKQNNGWNREWLAWLEKQGEQPTDKLEPKFKVGDWIIFIASESIYRVEKIGNHEYTLRHILGGLLCLSFSNEELIREWTITDAKDGDVLVSNGKRGQEVGIVKKFIGKYGGYDKCFETYFYSDLDGTFRIGEYMGGTSIHPATKEQRDLLFQKMVDEGYEWNAEKKELKTIEQKHVDNVEPKFKAGDWIVLPLGIIAHIDSLNSTDYQVTTTDGKICDFKISKQDNYRLWTIADAKDGDVLVASDGSIFLFAGVDDCACKYYVALTTDNCLKINKEVKGGYWETSRAVYPATKEQRDLLFQKMTDAGYEFVNGHITRF